MTASCRRFVFLQKVITKDTTIMACVILDVVTFESSTATSLL